MRNILLIIISVLSSLGTGAQNRSEVISKLSPYMRRIVMDQRSTRADDNRTVMAFVRTSSGNDEIIKNNGCRIHAVMGSVYVVEIPINKISTLISSKEVERIEAGRSCSVQLDTTRYCVDYHNVQSGINVPRAYTGRGVVMGIMDVGFDLTNPTFYSRDMKDYRICSFWDMLSSDRDTSFVVGRDYIGRDEILEQKHSADNLLISHGTHTLGIAAGSGYNSNYIGVAPESDICLVNNAVVEDTVLIAPEDIDKYTSATDALGFKYIFDYAASQNKPCVISFSEGSRQGFDEDNVLFYEALESLIGPGRILVASAGNDGGMNITLTKPASSDKIGSFIYCPTNEAYFLLKSTSDFVMLLKSYGAVEPHKIIISSKDVQQAENGEYHVIKETGSADYDITVVATSSAFNPDETVYEMIIKGDDHIGGLIPFSVELCGYGAPVQMYAYNSVFVDNQLDTDLSYGSSDYTILTPGSAPAVICVGASSYRKGFTNYLGEYKTWDNGYDGVIAPYSSKGPTFDGRIKPEVVAPGTNVISSYSSYYIDAKPDAFDTQSDVTRYEYNGRTYSWNANTGTSMSSPVVGGIIALWLEANPNLSPDDIREIFATTCSHNDSTMEYPNNIWGHGEINAYRGLCHILNIDGIEGITSEARDYVLIPSSGGFDIRFSESLADEVSVDVFNISGQKIINRTLMPGSTTYHIQAAPGVYAVRVKLIEGYQSMLVRVGL